MRTYCHQVAKSKINFGIFCIILLASCVNLMRMEEKTRRERDRKRGRRVAKRLLWDYGSCYEKLAVWKSVRTALLNDVLTSLAEWEAFRWRFQPLGGQLTLGEHLSHWQVALFHLLPPLLLLLPPPPLAVPLPEGSNTTMITTNKASRTEQKKPRKIWLTFAVFCCFFFLFCFLDSLTQKREN